MASAMAMGMDIMGRSKNRTNPLFLGKTEKCGLGLWFMVCFVPSAVAKVLDFEIKPTLTASQIYSDNFNLRSSSLGQAQGGFVTQLAPAFNIDRNSATTKFKLNYRLQFLYYEGVDIDPRLYNQLQMTSKTEIFNDSVFIDSSSTIGQGNASSIGAFATNNVAQSATVNSTTYRTFRVSPYWLPHLGGYADGEVRVSYMRFDNSGSRNLTTATGGVNTINDLGSDAYQESIYLRSGKKMESTGWSGRFSFSNQDQQYKSTSSSSLRFRSSNGELSYRLIDDVSAFVQLGYYDNVYSGGISPNNGIYITPGLSWTPSPQFSLAAGYGINAYFTNLIWHPSERTSFLLNYRDSKVGGGNCGLTGLGVGGAVGSALSSNTGCGTTSGTGLGAYGSGGVGPTATGTGFATGPLGASNSGSVWTASFQHRTRTSTWSASYYTTTTTVQQFLASQATFTTPADLNGNPTGPATANDRSINSPNFTDGIVISKRAQFAVSWFLSKHTFSFSGYQNNFAYSGGNRRNQDILGVLASWSYRFTPQVSAILQGSWQSSEYPGGNAGAGSAKTDYSSVSLSISRQLSSFATGSLQFSHFQTDSGSSANTRNIFGILGSYDANQVAASLNVRF